MGSKIVLDKVEKALLACEKVIEGIEDRTISTESALLQCTKIARLLNDEEALIWLQYEYGGYPRNEDGHVERTAWELAYKMGRGYVSDGKKLIFTELVSELEERILANRSAVGNFTTSGTSVAGDYAAIAVSNLTHAVTTSTTAMLNTIATSQKRLSLLKAKYYEYALKKLIELSFGNVASNIFTEYRECVDNAYSTMSKESLLKLQAIEGKLESDNPEMYSQALLTCRRVFESVAAELFVKYYPDYSEKMYKTKSGKEIDVSGDHYKNKLSAVIELLEDKSVSKTLVGSNIMYLLDWIDNIIDLQCKGVHSDITRDDARKCIIQTYICLGDILSM